MLADRRISKDVASSGSSCPHRVMTRSRPSAASALAYLSPRKERAAAGGPLNHHAASDSRLPKSMVAISVFARNECESPKVPDV